MCSGRALHASHEACSTGWTRSSRGGARELQRVLAYMHWRLHEGMVIHRLDEDAAAGKPGNCTNVSASLCWQLHEGCGHCRRLDEDAAAGKHGNCAEVLAAIARSRSSPLTSQLCEPARLEGLMKRAIVPPPDTPSVQVCSAGLPGMRAMCCQLGWAVEARSVRCRCSQKDCLHAQHVRLWESLTLPALGGSEVASGEGRTAMLLCMLKVQQPVPHPLYVVASHVVNEANQSCEVHSCLGSVRCTLWHRP